MEHSFSLNDMKLFLDDYNDEALFSEEESIQMQINKALLQSIMPSSAVMLNEQKMLLILSVIYITQH